MEKNALALSGGGYRATLFSLGSLWRLNELGYLNKLSTITSVSGGSIASGVLAMNWSKLVWDQSGVATNFEGQIADPIRRLCSTSIDVKAGISGLLSFRHSIGDKVARKYAKVLYGKARLKDIPFGDDVPHFIFYATSYQTGRSVRITRNRIYDHLIGEMPNPDLTIAQTVGASSAFPPFFSPVIIKTDPGKWIRTEYADLFDEVAYRKKMILTDGGLYDNLGLEAIWKKGGEYKVVLVCDAGAPIKKKPKLWKNWIRQYARMTDVMIDQQRGLRKRTLMNDRFGNDYGGVYWGITTKISDYELDNTVVVDSKITDNLQATSTRLTAFSPELQGHIINWGYALTDAGMRTRVLENEPADGVQPDANYPL